MHSGDTTGPSKKRWLPKKSLLVSIHQGLCCSSRVFVGFRFFAAPGYSFWLSSFRCNPRSGQTNNPHVAQKLGRHFQSRTGTRMKQDLWRKTQACSPWDGATKELQQHTAGIPACSSPACVYWTHLWTSLTHSNTRKPTRWSLESFVPGLRARAAQEQVWRAAAAVYGKGRTKTSPFGHSSYHHSLTSF